jgi:hypothetical protein
MLAGRPHEAAGNGSPRWMTAAPRERGTEPGLQAGSPAPSNADLRRSIARRSVRALSGHMSGGSLAVLVQSFADLLHVLG